MDDILINLKDLFLGNGIIIVIGCLVIGMIIKGSIKNLPNNFIPYINAIAAIVLGFIIPGTFEGEFVVSKIIMLAFLGLSSVGLYEALCIVLKDRFSVDIKNVYNNIVNQDKKESSSQAYEDFPTTSNDEDDSDFEP